MEVINKLGSMSILLSLIILSTGAGAKTVQPQPWEEKMQQLQLQKDAIFGMLEEIHSALVPVAREENPALLARLSLEPPKPLATGYGLLPAVHENSPLVTVKPKQKFYSLRGLEDHLIEEYKNTVKLADNLQRASSHLEPLVARFEKLLKVLRNLESNLTYHAYWQRAVIDHSEYFARRNRILALVREMEALRKNGDSPKRVAGLHLQVLERLVIFTKTPGLAFKEEENGTRILPVTVVTDIDTKEFLASFRAGIEAAFVRSTAARSMRFAVDLKIQQIPPAELYPEGVPPHGSAIDMKTHMARFPKDALVLTTSGKSTQAWTGRSIILGPEPITRRSLAHEFGHLIGFNDAYVRGYDGNPRDRFGAVLIEWHGLVDDLMGDSDGGRVTEEMIETLIEAYGKGPQKGGTD